MAYNLTVMIWIGRIGSDAVAAVGAAGMYMWLSNGLASLAKDVYKRQRLHFLLQMKYHAPEFPEDTFHLLPQIHH